MAVQVIFTTLRIILGAVFLFAGVLKIWDFPQHKWATPAFYEDISNYHLDETAPVKFAMAHIPAIKPATLSDGAMLLAVYLPWLEVILGAALLLGRAIAGAGAIASLLMCVFIAALASAWLRNLDITCGCFGHENATENFPLLLARDCALLLAALATTRRGARQARR